MFIKHIKINGFGGIENKEVNLINGLNVIKGSNESGKSTITNFIRSMFYGISKNKDGKKFSDYERFKPWMASAFGGELTYDYNDKEYTVFRDFNKNNSKVFDAEGNEITTNFNKDKNRGVEIGREHLKIDEETFNNSLLVAQSGVAVEVSTQNTMIQKLTNMIQLGEKGTSYEKTKSKLEKMLTDEVGTLRTQSKPINVVNREILTYTKQKEDLIRNRHRSLEIEKELKDLKVKRDNNLKSSEEAKKVYEVKSKYDSMLEEKRNAYETAKKLMDKEKAEYEKSRRRRMIEGTIAIGTLFFIIVSVLIILKQYIYGIACLLLAICFVWLYRELEKKEERVFAELNFDIMQEEVIKKEKKELKTLEESGINGGLLERKTASLKELIDGYENVKNSLSLEEHKLMLESNSLKDELSKYNDAEENLQIALDKKEELEKLEYSIKLAIEKLEESYEDIKSEIVPEINRLIKENVSKTTEGRYCDIMYNDESGLLAKTESGDLVTIDKLSIGTIDQIYLGFRFAIANRFDENIPLILDETFVFYDDDRLENVLKTIERMSKEKQIILLTCSNRETDLFEKNKIKVNEICL